MRRVALAAFLVLANCLTSSAQDERSLTNFESRIPDNLESRDSSSHVDDPLSQERILVLEETIQSLTDTIVSLALKKEEAEKRLAELDVSSNTEANNDLDLLKEIKFLNSENERLKSLVQQSSEVLVLASENGQINSPFIRSHVEGCLRDISSFFSATNLPQKNKTSHIAVLHADTSKSLLVLDAGRNMGLKIGAPIEIMRGEQPHAIAIIIEVREQISAAVIQSYLQRNFNPLPGDLVKLKI